MPKCNGVFYLNRSIFPSFCPSLEVSVLVLGSYLRYIFLCCFFISEAGSGPDVAVRLMLTSCCFDEKSSGKTAGTAILQPFLDHTFPFPSAT